MQVKGLLLRSLHRFSKAPDFVSGDLRRSLGNQPFHEGPVFAALSDR